MNPIIEKHLHFIVAKEPQTEMDWIQSSEKTSKELLSYLNKKDINLTDEQLLELENNIRTVISLPLSKPAYNAYGHVIYLISKRLNKEMTKEPFILRASLTDNKRIINDIDLEEIINCVKSRSFEIISSTIESLKQFILENQMNIEIENDLGELVYLVRKELLLTQDSKEWVILKDGYLGLIPFLNEEQCRKELIYCSSISWNCKGKYVMIDALIPKTKNIILSIIPNVLREVVNAVEETTYKTVSLNVLSRLIKEKVVSIENVIDCIDTCDESSMNIISTIISLIPTKDQLIYCSQKHPLPTASALKLNSYDMNYIITLIPLIEKEVIKSLQNSSNKSFHLGVITSLHSDLTRVNYHILEVDFAKEILKGLYDCSTDEIQVVTTLIPKFILRCPNEIINDLFNFILHFVSAPFTEAIDCSVIQIIINLLQNTKRADIKPILSQFVSSSQIQLLLQRSILSRTDRLRAIAFNLYGLLDNFTLAHQTYLKTQLETSWDNIMSLRSSEADSMARIFSLLCKFKPYPILSDGSIKLIGNSLEESIHSIISRLTSLVDLIEPSKCASYENNCVYGLFRILQLLRREKDGFYLALKTVDSSEYLLTLPAPEGTAPGMVVGGWTSVRVASELIASQASINFGEASERLIHIVRTALHRGIFERAATALETSLSNASNEWLSKEVIKVVNEIGFETKFTRRSAGLPYHLSALLGEECRRIKQPTMAPPLLRYVFEKLTQCDRSCAIHSMNTLAGLIRSQKIANEIDMFFPGKALNYSIEYMDDSDWSLRNSSSILSATVIKRMFASQESFTIDHLIFLIPESIPKFNEALIKSLNGATVVCMILSRLSPSSNITQSDLQKSLVKSLLIASHRKLPAPCVDALAVAFTKCSTLGQIPEIFNSITSVTLRVIKEYVDSANILSQEQISSIASFKPQTSYDAYQYLNILESLHLKLPELNQFHYNTNDAYTLKCVKIIAKHHANNDDKVIELLQSELVIVRESALLRCEENPVGIKPSEFFNATFKLLFKEAPHVLHVLKAMIAVIDYDESCIKYISSKEEMISQLKILVEKEPLVCSLSIALLMRLNHFENTHFNDITFNQHEVEYYLKHFYTIESQMNLIYTLLENTEKKIAVTNAFNSVFKTCYDSRTLLHYLINSLISDIKKESNDVLLNQLCFTLFDPSMFDYLNEITHTNQIFEPELPSFNYNRIELIELLRSQLNSNILDTYITNLKSHAINCLQNDSIELIKQLSSSFQSELN